ncbi:ArpU family phage packaging/lysis transcriptional regulator [Bacillus sp. B-jedd]|uniref:ArpU family phage packaging/lysis transcriptional regulator n=1 Tax=Bacillus sp. B-jedd TaxID=1476857 RepID=UPI0005156697|nr:ArpU family phage packaging/lysis transcriptional regulator [Bacillus sp. B-jedd]CEG29813.1 phage transcriptional regulator, ArpU family [Bacillus sp. B-jedd]
MGNQINFNLPSIDREATKKAVEAALEKYRIFLLTQSPDKQPKVTQNFSMEMPAYSNQFHSSTEEAAIKNADYEMEREQYIRRIVLAVNRLSHWERSIIIMRYMSQEDYYDYELYNEMGMSERKYYRLKAKAFYRLAFALKVEVYEEGVTA